MFFFIMMEMLADIYNFMSDIEKFRLSNFSDELDVLFFIMTMLVDIYR